jgi:hypothetical protein
MYIFVWASVCACTWDSLNGFTHDKRLLSGSVFVSGVVISRPPFELKSKMFIFLIWGQNNK